MRAFDVAFFFFSNMFKSRIKGRLNACVCAEYNTCSQRCQLKSTELFFAVKVVLNYPHKLTDKRIGRNNINFCILIFRVNSVQLSRAVNSAVIKNNSLSRGFQGNIGNNIHFIDCIFEKLCISFEMFVAKSCINNIINII